MNYVTRTSSFFLFFLSVSVCLALTSFLPPRSCHPRVCLRPCVRGGAWFSQAAPRNRSCKAEIAIGASEHNGVGLLNSAVSLLLLHAHTQPNAHTNMHRMCVSVCRGRAVKCMHACVRLCVVRWAARTPRGTNVNGCSELWRALRIDSRCLLSRAAKPAAHAMHGSFSKRRGKVK